MISDTSKITDVKNCEYGNRSRLQIYIENRLMDYGFSAQNNPTKYQIYSSVRRLVSLHLGVGGRSMLTDNELDRAIEIVDNILPSKSNSNPIVEKYKKDSKSEFQELVGNDIHKLADYLEDKSRIDINGMAGPECYVNKEALRISASYIRDYIDILDSSSEVYISGKIIVRLNKNPGKYPTLDRLLVEILENNEHIPCWKSLTSQQKLEWNNFIKDNQDLEM